MTAAAGARFQATTARTTGPTGTTTAQAWLTPRSGTTIANRSRILRLQVLREGAHALVRAPAAEHDLVEAGCVQSNGVMVRFGKLLRPCTPLVPWHTEQYCVYFSPPCEMTSAAAPSTAAD